MGSEDAAYRYKLLSYFIDHIPDTIYFKDIKGRLVFANQSYADGLGLALKEVVGKTEFDLFPKKQAQRLAKDDQSVIKTGKPIIDKIERTSSADGADNYISTTKIPHFGPKGELIGIIGISRDISKRVRFEFLKEKNLSREKRLKQWEEVNRLKSEFISAVSHELRTPLAVVKQLLMFVFEETAGPLNDKQREILVKARSNTERLKNIIDNLLDISRIEGKRLKLSYSLVNINVLIRESEDFFRELAAEKGIELSYHLPQEELNLYIDAERIVQVISNLINNAIKFTPENGKIRIEMEIVDDKVRIAVKDTGIGISKSDLPQLFGKFVQVSGLPGMEKKGIGLGLSICKELVERHGGEIWVESKFKAGSTFYFTLPVYYSLKIFGKPIRDKINHLIKEGVSVYIVNFLIINYKEFRERIRVQADKLFEDFERIVNAAVKDVFGLEKQKGVMFLVDKRTGECSVILPGATEKMLDEFCELVKGRTKDYLTKNRIGEVFIALGILKPKIDPGKDWRNLKVKEIYIGAEMRLHKRIDYQTDIEITFPDKTTGSFKTIDISKSGICCESPGILKTDTKLKIKFSLLRKKAQISTIARVCWIKELKDQNDGKGKRYTIGLQWLGLKSQDQNNLDEELKLYYD